MDARSGQEHASALRGDNIAYFTTKEFDKSLKAAFMGGGQRQKKALKAKAILGSLGDNDPFATVPVTNHGESRIRHCVKYDLGDGWRLITQKTDKTCGFLFLGDHEDADAWLESHKGQQFGVKDGKAVLVPGVGRTIDYASADRADHHDKSLVELLDAAAMDFVLSGVPRSVARKLEALDGRASSGELADIATQINTRTPPNS